MFKPDSVPTVYGWWNHWPVAQMPGDGRWIVTPDKPGHFNLTTFVQWKEYNKTDKTKTRIMLQGMTTGRPANLYLLQNHGFMHLKWLFPQKDLMVEFMMKQKGLMFWKKPLSLMIPLEFNMNGSEESPLINPAIIIKNWGNQPVTLSIDGKNKDAGSGFQAGHTKRTGRG